jgi:hypothetical protein
MPSGGLVAREKRDETLRACAIDCLLSAYRHEICFAARGDIPPDQPEKHSCATPSFRPTIRPASPTVVKPTYQLSSNCDGSGFFFWYQFRRTQPDFQRQQSLTLIDHDKSALRWLVVPYADRARWRVNAALTLSAQDDNSTR